MAEKKAELKDRLQLAMNLRGKKAVDLSNDLNIPKSAISQYLSGKSQNMDSERLFMICKYLEVSEPWMLGFDVPMENTTQKINDAIASIVVRLRKDSEFLSVVEMLNGLDAEKIAGVKQMLSALLK